MTGKCPLCNESTKLYANHAGENTGICKACLKPILSRMSNFLDEQRTVILPSENFPISNPDLQLVV